VLQPKMRGSCSVFVGCGDHIPFCRALARFCLHWQLAYRKPREKRVRQWVLRRQQLADRCWVAISRMARVGQPMHRTEEA